MSVSYTGIRFPFRFNNTGGVDTSSTDSMFFPHIVESVQQITGTNMPERFFNPNFGVNMRHLVFKAMTKNLLTLYDTLIIEGVTKWDNRVSTVFTSEIKNIEGTLQGELEIELKDIEKYNTE